MREKRKGEREREKIRGERKTRGKWRVKEEKRGRERGREEMCLKVVIEQVSRIRTGLKNNKKQAEAKKRREGRERKGGSIQRETNNSKHTHTRFIGLVPCLRDHFLSFLFFGLII